MIEFKPIATVFNKRDNLDDDDWGSVISRIELDPDLAAGLFLGLDEFSHVEVIFIFDRKLDRQPPAATRHPRNNKDWPLLGLLAQRSSYHPNPIGLCTARILGVEGRTLTVQGLDAVNGTPILDLKPVFREFLPKAVEQPGWVSELMQNYWKKP